MEFQDLFKPRAIPTTISLASSPVDVLTYIKAKGTLALDIDFIDDYINHHTPEHPDNWDVDEDCVDAIEHFRNLAEKEQEVEDARWEAAVNNPDHPDHAKEMAKLKDTTVWVVQCWDEENTHFFVAKSEEEAKRHLLDVVFNKDFSDFEELESYRSHTFKIHPAQLIGGANE